jgi:glycine betaine/proline transport system ATP-binding protein
MTLLRANNRKAAFVVTKSHKLLGVTKMESLTKLISKDDKPNIIPESAIRKVTAVSPDTILEELFPIVSENPSPIPVVDENNRFLGVVTTDQIFESISVTEGEENV